MRCLPYFLLFCLLPLSAFAKTVVVPMNYVSDTGKNESVGDITLTSTKSGVTFTPHLHGLPPGLHGFHIHDKPSCGDKGMAAGDHLDPASTQKHKGPYKEGHLGDLPALYVADDGTAKASLNAPRLTIAELSGHTLMIHKGGDNYSDIPEKNGGGGARIICGVIE